MFRDKFLFVLTFFATFFLLVNFFNELRHFSRAKGTLIAWRHLVTYKSDFNVHLDKKYITIRLCLCPWFK